MKDIENLAYGTWAVHLSHSAYRAVEVIPREHASKKFHMKKWIGCLWLIIGVFIGGVLFSSIRMFYYATKGLQPNMTPQMFVLFSPVISAPIAILAVIIHSVFGQYFRYNSYGKWFFAGILYSSLLLGLLSPWFLLIPLFLNPVTLKLLIAKL